MNIEPSKQENNTVSIVQEIPDVVLLHLLDYLPENDKWALWQCCRYLQANVSDRFIRVRSAFPDCDYEQDDPHMIATFSIPRLNSKYKNTLFEQLGSEHLAVFYPSGEVRIVELHTGTAIANDQLDQPVQQVVSTHNIICARKANGSLVVLELGRGSALIVRSIDCSLNTLVDMVHYQDQQYVIASADECYLLDLEKKQVEKKFRSRDAIVSLAMNIQKRLVVTVNIDDCLHFRFVELPTFQFIRSLEARNCDDVGISDDLIQVKINRAGYAIRFFKGNIIQQMSIYRSEDDHDQVIIPTNLDQKDVHVLRDGQLCFVQKQADDQFAVTINRY